MRELPIRKNGRLAGYDYSRNGAYFITVCIKDRLELLGRATVGHDALGVPHIKLSSYGEIVKREIEETPSHYDNVEIYKYVIMPNHIHMIISIRNRDGAPRVSRPTSALIPSIIAIIKKKVNKQIGFSIWQSSYHDHIIRSEAEYRRVWQYIDENPLSWQNDEYNPMKSP